jgi:hypothetical protein
MTGFSSSIESDCPKVGPAMLDSAKHTPSDHQPFLLRTIQ